MIAGCILAYIIIPFIIYSINDYFAGLWYDRVKWCMSVYEVGNMVIIFYGHLFWPIFMLGLGGIWLYQFKVYKFGKFDFGKMYDAGKAKRKRDTDLDYQAELHLLGKK